MEFAAELFCKAKRAVVLTGAGLSTPSGIPDFRSEGTGLWSRQEPLEVASMNTFRTHPEKFYAWFRPLANRIFEAKPNLAHIALAELEQAGRIHSIITQNIDMLHQKAGSKNVIEMHGTLRTFSCTQCYEQTDARAYLQPFVEKGEIPHCPRCGAILKPDVILFGEQLPQKACFEAQRDCRSCDLMLVAGSSLEVLPVAGLPMQALDRGAHLIIVNNSPTYLDVRADAVLSEDVIEVIPAIAEQVLNG
ncbi:MAG: NAD-dependent deacylase [Chloroflexi bacterium]|nr:NAD-dependent deacylase [Chloroflexota bacterium]MBI1856417.1 NAD-dependent deacylase [Chloroflexota bacterium]MBI3339128.1 NAD-dependent deacylase [Chloroflexota bacterium]